MVSPNTSYWYFLHSRYGLKVRNAKRQAAKSYKWKMLQAKKLLGWHRYNEYLVGNLKIEYEVVQ